MIGVSVDVQAIRTMLAESIVACGDLSQPLREAGEYMVNVSIPQNFAAGGRPEWADLKPSTLRSQPRVAQTPLMKTGDLASSIKYRATRDELEVYSEPKADPVKAIVAQRGARIRGHDKSTGNRRRTSRGRFAGDIVIPARPFLVFQPEDYEWIANRIYRHAFRWLARNAPEGLVA